MNQAKLPREYLQREIKDMEEGEIKFTTPWGMYADSDRNLFLNDGYSIYATPLGTSTMKVEKKNGKYYVDISKCSGYKWNPGLPHYVGEFTPIPVEKLETMSIFDRAKNFMGEI